MRMLDMMHGMNCAALPEETVDMSTVSSGRADRNKPCVRMALVKGGPAGRREAGMPLDKRHPHANPEYRRDTP